LPQNLPVCYLQNERMEVFLYLKTTYVRLDFPDFR
jgi:hypothetical protein